MAKITGETKTGFKFEINDEILTDWDFTDAYMAILNDDADPREMFASLKKILSLLFEDGGKAFRAHVKEIHGGNTTPVPVLCAELVEMLETNGEVKNS